ncbi:hypothetical protein GCM10022419_111030 [Nonomuraea rosea]|uniref:Uncharacterized protein n=1 Tax=Nonomuraea rosea TaxID=638574 RepID=A0ABP6ZGH9_9ACTN
MPITVPEDPYRQPYMRAYTALARELATVISIRYLDVYDEQGAYGA